MLPALNTTVLVVEDELLVRLDLSEALEAAGYAVRHASSAAAALEILESDRTIGVVFTDIKMDGPRDGVELAHRIRDHWPETIVVYSSAHIPKERLLTPDGVILMPKPYNLVDLKEILAEIAKQLRRG